VCRVYIGEAGREATRLAGGRKELVRMAHGRAVRFECSRKLRGILRMS
jgi:hypothetical protein